MKFVNRKTLCSLLLLALPLAAHAAPGDLDPTFGNGGKRVLAYDFGGDNTDRGFNVIVDGSRSYVIGDATTSQNTVTATITRLQADIGSLEGILRFAGVVDPHLLTRRIWLLRGALWWFVLPVVVSIAAIVGLIVFGHQSDCIAPF